MSKDIININVVQKTIKSYPHHNTCTNTYLLYNINTMITASINVFDINKGSFLFHF